jgi:hypothetical protein
MPNRRPLQGICWPQAPGDRCHFLPGSADHEDTKRNCSASFSMLLCPVTNLWASERCRQRQQKGIQFDPPEMPSANQKFSSWRKSCRGQKGLGCSLGRLIVGGDAFLSPATAHCPFKKTCWPIGPFVAALCPLFVLEFSENRAGWLLIKRAVCDLPPPVCFCLLCSV